MTTDYDPLSPSTLDDPFTAYHELRDRCPVHHHDDFTPPFFTVSRYDDVRTGLIDHGTWSIRYGQSPQYTRPAGLVNDPPEHTAFRQLFNRAFTPRMVGRVEDRIEGLGNELLDAVIDAGEGDFRSFYARPLPTTIIAWLLGIPTADRELFARLSDDLTATYNAPDPAASAGPRAAFDDYFAGILADRRALVEARGPDALPDDLISGFILAEVDGRRLTDHELAWMLLLLLLGGNETSTALLTNLVWRLLAEPDRWAAVRDDPGLHEIAVEESLRHDPPVLGLYRTPTRDLELHGTAIPAKAKVMLCYGSANHDPEVFERPDEFRLDRPLDEARRNLTFGFGAHFCPGAALARLEARVTLRLLTARMPNLALAGPTTRIVAFNLWGRASLPVRW